MCCGAMKGKCSSSWLQWFINICMTSDLADSAMLMYNTITADGMLGMQSVQVSWSSLKLKTSYLRRRVLSETLSNQNKTKHDMPHASRDTMCVTSQVQKLSKLQPQASPSEYCLTASGQSSGAQYQQQS